MQPVPAIPEVDLAMLARDETLRIRQRPVKVGIPTDIDPSTVDIDGDRPTIR